MKKTLCGLFILMSSMLFSFQISPEQKKLYQARLSMVFGEKTSDKEVYIFTSWADPELEKIEPYLEKIAPKMARSARLYFMDEPGKNSAYVNTHIEFLLNTQKTLVEYFVFRNKLIKDVKNKQPAQTIKAPEDVLQAGLKICDATYKNMKISTTPSILIYDLKTQGKVLLEGFEAITKADDKLFK